MYIPIATSSLAHPSDSVNPSINSQLPLFPASMIHHKSFKYLHSRLVLYNGYERRKSYGVSRDYRILSPQLLLKKFDYIRDCLQYRLSLTIAQREATLRLLRYWAYYSKVYVKEAQVTSEPGCSKATYWRTIRLLEGMGLIKVINRFVIRPHAQISNLYVLTQLCKVLARYLAEHGYWVWEKWLEPMLRMPDLVFWAFLSPLQESRASP